MRKTFANMRLLTALAFGAVMPTCTPSGPGTPSQQCAVQGGCTERCDGIRDEMSAPGPPVSLFSAECRESEGVGYCFCELADDEGVDLNGGLAIKTEGDADGCTLRGRDDDCLYSASDFPGCDENVAGSCDDACVDAVGRWTDDQSRTLDFSVKSSECSNGDCVCIFELNGKCFVPFAVTECPGE